jgi:hypothetical protein
MHHLYTRDTAHLSAVVLVLLCLLFALAVSG